MTWTWDEVRREWLRDGGLADDPDVIVEAFNRVEWYLGRVWIEQSREWGGPVVSGTAVTLNVVIKGRLLGPWMASRELTSSSRSSPPTRR
jgi:hypothetical protein